MAKSSQGGPQRTTIDRHLEAVYQPFAMVAGVRLDVFTTLADGPMTVEGVARSLEVGAGKLEPLLYALVSADLLTVDEGRFANTPEADHYLVRGRPTYIGREVAARAEIWAATLKTDETIRTGLPQGKRDFAAMPEHELETFFAKEHLGAMLAGRLLVDDFGLCRFTRLLDAAGGSGGLAIAACEACPALSASVADLASVTPFTQRFVDQAGLADRIAVLALDFVEHAPAGSYDAAVLRNFIQVVGPDLSRRALANIGQSLEPGGAIFIIGWVLDDSRLSPPEIAASNFSFLNFYDEGRAYTDAEHRAWLAEAGFGEIERTLLPEGSCVIRATKAGG